MSAEPFEGVTVPCPKCKMHAATVYDDGEAERLICDHCFYEEWDQPRGTYPQLARLDRCT